jgi:hypothetical protein
MQDRKDAHLLHAFVRHDDALSQLTVIRSGGGLDMGQLQGRTAGRKGSTSHGQAQNRGNKVNSEHGDFRIFHQLLKGD